MVVMHMRRFREERRRGQEEVKTGGALVGWTDQRRTAGRRTRWR